MFRGLKTHYIHNIGAEKGVHYKEAVPFSKGLLLIGGSTVTLCSSVSDRVLWLLIFSCLPSSEPSLSSFQATPLPDGRSMLVTWILEYDGGPNITEFSIQVSIMGEMGQ